MSNELTSKFFEIEDEHVEKLDDFEIPIEWWSRTREYAWAIKMLNKDDIIIDAGCGTTHPFKEYASKRVKKCYAVDKDLEIKSFENTDKLEFINMEFGEMESKFAPNSIDKIFCISVLEHMYPMNIINTLNIFKKILKPNGKIILTIDYPLLAPETLMNWMHDVGLTFFGSVDFSIDKHKVIKGSYGNLKCYRAILCKPEEEQIEEITICEPTNETIQIKPKETKPKKPKEIK